MNWAKYLKTIYIGIFVSEQFQGQDGKLKSPDDELESKAIDELSSKVMTMDGKMASFSPSQSSEMESQLEKREFLNNSETSTNGKKKKVVFFAQNVA